MEAYLQITAMLHEVSFAPVKAALKALEVYTSLFRQYILAGATGLQ